LYVLLLQKGSFVFLAMAYSVGKKTNVPFERWLRLVANGLVYGS